LPDSGSVTEVEGVDARFIEVWRAFLGELALDAHKAHAAAMAYRELDGHARETWIRALEQDSGEIHAPKIAIYAPLLAVEADAARRRRILDAVGQLDAASAPTTAPRALAGRGDQGERVMVLVAPLYLHFVQVLACGVGGGDGFAWVRHDPILAEGDAPRPGTVVAGATLEAEVVNVLVDELAMAVVAHTRSGRVIPDALRLFAEWFAPIGASTGSE
jgi:hypothetical protein